MGGKCKWISDGCNGGTFLTHAGRCPKQNAKIKCCKPGDEPDCSDSGRLTMFCSPLRLVHYTARYDLCQDPVNDCPCDVRYSGTECAHTLSNWMIETGRIRPNPPGSTAGGRCPEGRVIRAKEMRDVFRKMGLRAHSGPPRGGADAYIYCESPRGHVSDAAAAAAVLYRPDTKTSSETPCLSTKRHCI